jgi:hypothetical protein
LRASTAISRVTGLHPGDEAANVARHFPAAGLATSANQKYGSDPRRLGDVAATLPSGATSESAPWTGFSATTMTRSGAPVHGAAGEGKTVRSATSAQSAANAGDCAAQKSNAPNPAATGSNAVAAVTNQLTRSI